MMNRVTWPIKREREKMIMITYGDYGIRKHTHVENGIDVLREVIISRRVDAINFPSVTYKFPICS